MPVVLGVVLGEVVGDLRALGDVGLAATTLRTAILGQLVRGVPHEDGHIDFNSTNWSSVTSVQQYMSSDNYLSLYGSLLDQ